MTFFRSTLFNFLFFSWTALVIILLWTTIFLPSSKFRSVISIWPKGCFALLKIIGLTFEVRGLENIPKHPVIFSVKHQSVWETIFFLWHHKENAYVMKSELSRIPFWGWYMKKSAHILVDRFGGTKSMRNMINKSRKILDDGRSIVIFPEGTRIPSGNMGKFHPGIAALYTQLNATVVPVAVNSGIFWPRRKFKKRPGNIIIEFLEPFKSGIDRKKFMTQLHDQIRIATQKLEKEAKIKKI